MIHKWQTSLRVGLRNWQSTWAIAAAGRTKFDKIPSTNRVTKGLVARMGPTAAKRMTHEKREQKKTKKDKGKLMIVKQNFVSCVWRAYLECGAL